MRRPATNPFLSFYQGKKSVNGKERLFFRSPLKESVSGKEKRLFFPFC
ncbi:MAG: hypothetical protein QXD98_00040 [Candidatus Diapherotrites archaeon]